LASTVPDSATPHSVTPPRRRIWRRIGRWLLGALAALLILPWAWIRLFQPEPGPVLLPAIADGQTARVFVFAYDRHTSLIVEQLPGWRLGPPGQETAPFVEFGWGDRVWYMEERRNVLTFLNAAFLPTATVAYTAGYEGPPDEIFEVGQVAVRRFDAAELRALLQTLEGAIVRQADGKRAEPFAPTATYPGQFYPGREYYIFWHSCNHWTVEVLRKSGQPVSERFVYTADQALGRLEGWERLR